ncbi:hypothetical protein C1646_758872 [Rhizophagus diaphanus]|nr:hypothetical protein C1646_758872 [Rhizophagus diaphanus] [Rhizophagus sp. MUCL 43196]
MELVKLNDENSFDPTPKLKSSPVPIFFVSFDERDNNCFHCGEKYTRTFIYGQKYCKKCLSYCLNNMTDINIHLDVYVRNRTKVPQNIQEFCLIILSFKQIFGYYQLFDNTYNDFVVFECEKYCKLCGKLLYQKRDHKFTTKFKYCSSCYLISIGCIESTLNKKFISIVYLPWWENTTTCYCNEKLVFTSNCQKYCENCFTFFIGCRYCLTTNIIFGITNQSQCKKCKRVSTIILDSKKIIGVNSGNSVLDDFLVNIRSYQLEIAKFANNVKNIDKYLIPSEIYYDPFRDNFKKQLMRYIPYSQFTNVNKIAEGGFSIVYQATWSDGSINNAYDIWTKEEDKVVILKRFKNSQCAKKYFMSELMTNYHCYYRHRSKRYSRYGIIKTYGFTKDPNLDDYILVIKYASEGDLYKYLQKEFTEINWKKKLEILYYITYG